MEKGSWFIGKNVNNTTFYVAAIDEKKTTLWTAKRDDSICFSTERTAHQFIKHNYSTRTDIFLVNLQIRYK